MGSFFINAGLAAGVALAALPVVLHLFMRQTPKRLVFPALRLIQERQRRSRKKLRIKNWLLLLARVLLLALMALALARPRVNSTTTLGDREVPTAMALVFDTSLSMAYNQQDKTRLDEAKERARAVLTRSHEASRVFVIDSAEPLAPPPLSPTAARTRVDALTIRAVNRPLNQAVARARGTIADAEEPRREVYVFSDLARSAWDTAAPVSPAASQAEQPTAEEEPKPAEQPATTEEPPPPELSTYLVRLGAREPRNAGIVEAGPMLGFATEGEEVPIQARIRSTGPASTRVVELLIDGAKRDQKTIELPADGEVVAQFTTPRLKPGLHQGEVRLAGEPDPLAIDDSRHFTLDVQPPLRVLIIADEEVEATFVTEALDPVALRGTGARPYPVDRITSAQLAGGQSRPLRDYAAVFLLNVDRLSSSAWGRLNQYVREGGGLVVGLGHRVDAADWNENAGALLPGRIGDLRSPAEPAFTFGEADLAHPLFAQNSRDLMAELGRVPIQKYRQVPPAEGSRVLLAYQNGDPALLERVFAGARAGRVLFWTTSLSRRPGNTDAERQATWTEFANPLAGWAYFALINDTVPYLAGMTGRRWTYEAGEDVALAIDPNRRYTTYTIQGPGAETADRLGEPIQDAGLLITAPPLIGQWTVTASGPDTPPRTFGFSVNVPESETRFTMLQEADLDTLFGGKEGYVLTDDTEEGLKRAQGIIRTGHELFPWIMALILLLVTAENVLANTFYRGQPTTAGAPQPSRRVAA